MNAALSYQDAFNTPTLEDLKPLDIGLDENELKALSHNLQLLHQYTATFNDQRAVCQAQVKQLIEECDVALDQRYPLMSFTKAPSEQNLSVVTEGVLHRIGTAFVEFLKKFWEILKKVFGWIVNAAKRLVHRDREVIEQVVVIRSLREASKQVQEIQGSSGKDHGALMDKFYTAVEHYHGQLTAMGLDMLHKGPYVAAVKALSLSVPKILKMLESKLIEIERRLNTHNPSQDTPTKENFVGLSDPVPVPYALMAAMKTWLHGSNDLEAWVDVMDIFHTAASQLHQEAPHTTMEWDAAASVIIDPHSGLAEPMIPIADGVLDYVTEMDKLIDKFRNHPITQALEGRDASQAEDALDSYMDDVRALLKYMEVANFTLDTQYHLVDSVAKCAYAEFDVQCAEHAVDEEAVKRIRAIRENLHTKIEARQR